MSNSEKAVETIFATTTRCSQQPTTVQQRRPAMTKTLADMTPEERDKCIGMWCDYDFPDGTTHRAILLSRGSSNTATVIDTTQCGVPQQWTRVDQLHPRFDLPRAFNPDGTPVHATRETQVGDDGLYLEANGTTFLHHPRHHLPPLGNRLGGC